MKSIKVNKQSLFLFSLLLLIILICSIKLEYFFSFSNFKNIVEANAYRLILAIGMTFIIASGRMDLSVGALVSLMGILSGLFIHGGLSAILSSILIIFIAILIGGFTGGLIHYTKINFFVITLALSGILRGIGLILSGSKPVSNLGADFIKFGTARIFFIQFPVIVALILVLLSFVLMNYTAFGSYVKSLGGNQDALNKCGIDVSKYMILNFMIMGFCSALAAIIITARLNSAEPNAGMGMELDAITATVMGGTPLSGGKASIFGTTIAIFILGIIRNVLTLVNVSSDYQILITGLLLFISVFIAEFKNDKVQTLYKKFFVKGEK